MLNLVMNQLDCDSHCPKSCHDIAEKIGVMKQQEESLYRCRDYILRRKLEEMRLSAQSPVSSNSILMDKNLANDDIDSLCRRRMCEWSYRIADHFGGQREIVAISINYLDRFLDKCNW